MRIHATRSSVCLGDDFAGPEEKDLVLDEQARLSELMKQLAGYVHKGYWQCMDTLREKQQIEKLWDSGKAPWKVWE